MKKLNRFRLPILAAGLLLALAIGFRSFLLANIIEPVALFFWAIWRVIASVDQNVYWILLILLCGGLMIRLVPAGKDFATKPSYRYEYKSPDRVEHWRRLMKEAASGKDGDAELHRSLRDLLMTMIAQAKRSPSTDPPAALEPGAISLPPAIRRFLQPEVKQEALSGSHRLHLLPPRWLRWQAGRRAGLDKASIEEAIQWMESYLEISHDE